MIAVDLGYVPSPLVVHLTSGSDFVQSLSTADGSNWPAGTVITLQVGDAAWPSTITGDTAAWNVDHTLVDALGPPGTTLRARITYTDGAGTELVWMTGRVVWDG